MKVTSRSVILAGAVLFLGTPAMAAVTSGLIGDCVDCHTMHNSEQGQPVAMVGTNLSATPIQNLLRMDCFACHADSSQTTGIVDMGGGSAVPQVNQSGGSTQDLAGGSFYYLNNGVRKGHNVQGLGYAADSNGNGGGGYNTPPGMYLGSSTHSTAQRFTMDGGFLKNFTCAGSAGCHGIRNRVASSTLNTNTTVGSFGYDSNAPGPAFEAGITRLTGIAAISGAHHNSQDGVKNPTALTAGTYTQMDGAYIAGSYRFIPGLKGAGNTTSNADRWANRSSVSHNEYSGVNGADTVASDSHGVMGSCGTCHISAGEEVYEISGTTASPLEHITTEGFMVVPNGTQSGFCVTCHGEFHSTGNAANGTSGAFLRHPSDYVIPNSTEYAAYQTYSITAPVARPDMTALPAADAVRPGTDLVMCLSCHMAHASQYDYMLRFDYSKMLAGDAATADLGTGCLACHTTKGILPGDR